MSRQLKREMNTAVKIIFIISSLLALVSCAGVIYFNFT